MTPSERLLYLASVLEAVPVERFDLAEWGTTTECGFAGCAVGWATQDPVLLAEGLRTEATPGGVVYPVCSTNGSGSCTASGWAAVHYFFGLAGRDAEHLFQWDSYSDPRDEEDRADAVYNPAPVEVAARIRAFVQSRSTT